MKKSYNYINGFHTNDNTPINVITFFIQTQK